MRTAFGMGLAVTALCAWAGPQAEEKALARRHEAVRQVRSLARGEGNPQAAIARLEFLGEQGWATIELSVLLGREFEVKSRRTIAMALAQLGHPASEPALFEALSDEDGTVRMYAVQGLGKVKSRAAAPRLVPLLKDNTLGVRREAARALGALADPRHGAALMDAARAEGDVETRALMLSMAGRTGDKTQMPGLETFLASSSEGTRFGAAQGLCALGSPKGYEHARALLASADRFERLQGLKLFEGVTAKVAAPVLSGLLVDADPAIAANAARLLYQGGDLGKLDWLVLRSHRATSVDEKMYFERELETLRVADDQRRAILSRAGIK